MTAYDGAGTEMAAVPIQTVLDTLATEYATPDLAVALCTVRMPEAAPHLVTLLNRAADRGLSRERDRVLLFRAVHILGAARVADACQPLLRLLRRSEDELNNILGDTVTETLPKIVAGVFDGNTPALFAAIGDRRISEAARWSLLSAAAFLTFDGRIERPAMQAFLARFHAERLASPLDSAWIGWGDAIAALGMAELAPVVEQVWGTFPPELASLSHFREMLADAVAAPSDASRFDALVAGYFEDAVTAFDWVRQTTERDDEVWEQAPAPIENPLRNVGRNDPCPCGSGKKYKKCCLNA